MTRTEAREALRKIYLQMAGTEPRILTHEVAQAGIDLAPMATCIDGQFHAYPKVTSYTQQVYASTSPDRVLAELKAAGFPRKHSSKFEHRREPRAE